MRIFCSCFDLGDQFLPNASYIPEIYVLDFVPEVNCHVSSLIVCEFALHRYFYCFDQFDQFLFVIHLKAKPQLVHRIDFWENCQLGPPSFLLAESFEAQPSIGFLKIAADASSNLIFQNRYHFMACLSKKSAEICTCIQCSH